MDLTIENLCTLLGWCSFVNLGLLAAWFLLIVFAGDFVFHMHTRWFKISRERFGEIHYVMMGRYKLAVFLLNLVPYLVLRWVDFQ